MVCILYKVIQLVVVIGEIRNSDYGINEAFVEIKDEERMKEFMARELSILLIKQITMEKFKEEFEINGLELENIQFKLYKTVKVDCKKKYCCRVSPIFSKSSDVEVLYESGSKWFGKISAILKVKSMKENKEEYCKDFVIIRSYETVGMNEIVFAEELILTDEFECIEANSILRKVHVIPDYDKVNTYYINERLYLS